MANRDNTGFRPAQKLDGSEIPKKVFPIDASNPTAVYIGDVVSVNAAGSVRPAVADDGTSVCGVVIGL